MIDLKGDGYGEIYEKDPLTYKGKLQIGTGMTVYDGLVYMDQRKNLIKVPVFIFIGSEDTVSQPKDIDQYYEEISSEDKEMCKVEGSKIKRNESQSE